LEVDAIAGLEEQAVLVAAVLSRCRIVDVGGEVEAVRVS
jgi:hypothetical protein